MINPGNASSRAGLDTCYPVGSRARLRPLKAMKAPDQPVVVSGLAEGIDTAAHQGAIDAGGKTVGVIGTPSKRATRPRIVSYKRS